VAGQGSEGGQRTLDEDKKAAAGDRYRPFRTGSRDRRETLRNRGRRQEARRTIECGQRLRPTIAIVGLRKQTSVVVEWASNGWNLRRARRQVVDPRLWRSRARKRVHVRARIRQGWPRGERLLWGAVGTNLKVRTTGDRGLESALSGRQGGV